MAHDETNRTDRRTFLQAGALATASAMGLAPGVARRTPREGPAHRRRCCPSGSWARPGIEVTLLDQGAAQGPERGPRSCGSPSRAASASSTPPRSTAPRANFKKWFAQDPAIRKQIVLVTKDMPREPARLAEDGRPAAGGPGDRLRRPVLHPRVGRQPYGSTTPIAFVKSRGVQGGGGQDPEARARRGSSASRPIIPSRAQLIQAAAEGGVIDAIMLQYRPWLDKDSPLNKAIDAAWNKGIGLISMKQIASQFFGDKPKGNILKEVVQRVPVLAERKLTPFQGLLHAIWTDERISAVCISMRNTDQIRENTDAARAVRAAQDGGHPRAPRRSSARTARRSAPTATADARSPPAPGPSWAT